MNLSFTNNSQQQNQGILLLLAFPIGHFILMYSNTKVCHHI